MILWSTTHYISPDLLREPVRLDRTNTAFHDLHRLARLFLVGEWQSTAGGREAGFALLFPMNLLFEKFIGKSLHRALASRRTVTVRLQDRRHHALSGEDREPPFNLQPDAVIGTPPDGPIVLDANRMVSVLPGAGSSTTGANPSTARCRSC